MQYYETFPRISQGGIAVVPDRKCRKSCKKLKEKNGTIQFLLMEPKGRGGWRGGWAGGRRGDEKLKNS